MTPSNMTISPTNKAVQAATAPRAGAVAGILFAVLFGISIVLIRLSVLTGSDDVSAWTANTLGRATLAVRLIPFACIFFLWFVGVIRDRLGASEDKFFATVTLGSALVFVALTLASSAVTGGLFYTYSTGGAEALPLGVYPFVHSIVNLVFNNYTVKMASVFMVSLATLVRITGVMPRMLSYLTYFLALVMLVTFSASLWLLLIFPAWVLLVSVYLLITNLYSKELP